MSYLFVVVFGAVAGWIAGQVVKGTDNMGALPDLSAGALGGVLLVFLSRLVGGDAAGGFMISAFVAVIGGAALLFAMRYAMKEAPAPVRPRRR